MDSECNHEKMGAANWILVFIPSLYQLTTEHMAQLYLTLINTRNTHVSTPSVNQLPQCANSLKVYMERSAFFKQPK